MRKGLSVPVVPGPSAQRRPRARRWVVPACGFVAVLCVVGVWLLWRVFVDTWAGQRVEDAALDGAAIGQGALWQVAEPVLDVVSVGFVAGGLLGAAAVAVARRRWSLALQVAVLVGGANLTTRLVKNEVLTRPVLGVGADYGNTLPSGHTTAAGSVAAAVLLAAPPRARPLVAVLGAAYTALTGVSTLVGQWHRPSDVVAGTLVVVLWTAIVCGAMAARPGAAATATASLRRVGGPDPWWLRTRRTASALVVLGVVTGGAALLLLARTWAFRAGPVSRADELLAYGGGVAGVVCACCLTFAVMLLLRHAAGSRDETASPSA
ncbi:phosphatase PAP2 family protein [Cellulomonas sp. S1-8]|uniref:phosphatase PAP2 family protein n=1 Tax=Cellulomonas sp. S1-8 TaxID=2904790 RepID=UPI002244EA9D|nr:phosphatase PAP2 family protein [Cellulomonas sp. S1-8]UZN03961.1 phosphatase PAP2 family protein [Cellulomonas sp. S1-8]